MQEGPGDLLSSPTSSPFYCLIFKRFFHYRLKMETLCLDAVVEVTFIYAVTLILFLLSFTSSIRAIGSCEIEKLSVDSKMKFLVPV